MYSKSYFSIINYRERLLLRGPNLGKLPISLVAQNARRVLLLCNIWVSLVYFFIIPRELDNNIFFELIFVFFFFYFS